jgi:ABC-type molybdenum transport system ATPase subunit/photorepair protein PhrA
MTIIAMPVACCKCKSIIYSSSRILGLGRSSASAKVIGHGKPCRHLSQPRAVPSTDNLLSDGQVITSEKEGAVSPLIRFQSADIRYPRPILDDGLRGLHNDDCVNIDRDLLLESQDSLETSQRGKQLHLQQNFWSKIHQLHDSHRVDLNIWPNLECNSGGGGHVVLGRNASGKTLLSRSIVQSWRSIPNQSVDINQSDTANNTYLHSGSITIHKQNSSKNRNHQFLSHVSFDSHSDLLLDKNTTTVHRALIPSGGNRLSPTAQFLTVRLGMFPLLHRRVDTLSTGEIRRVLLVRALVSKPELLVLDNAFDGLDVRGRLGLQDIIERVLKGFRMDILVQGINAKDTARTQVLLLTHRPEEIADGFGRVTFIDKGVGNGMRTEERRGRKGEELVRSLVLRDGGKMSSNGSGDVISGSRLPSNVDILSFWEHGRSKRDASNTVRKDVLLQSQNLKVTRDGTNILSHLNWTVQRGERWHLAGTNGTC